MTAFAAHLSSGVGRAAIGRRVPRQARARAHTNASERHARASVRGLRSIACALVIATPRMGSGAVSDGGQQPS
jgi:hypothetical protein